ncbi:uncharacterized protein EDB91DRAFT_1253141 [Suillus paluster]|uniref:uncharacterized protein n=1 Tax=Suillus paluster TaxID=48578 RepID=UPI001B86339E|nr:uncharacterized protein EDB91DRAFT_1253141 [Suillus paluster]KAG1729221.1 hypothetical protein EDB91DRAFT_1253141 [Suillus paluster]
MSKKASTFVVESEGLDGHLLWSLHHLAYLDLAFADDDTDLAHDYLTIQFHTMFNFHQGAAHTLHSHRGKSRKHSCRFVAVRSPDIMLKATMSHPPSLKLANALSDITTTLLNGVLPQVHDEWFKGCWKTVELPSHLLCDNHCTSLSASKIKTIGPVVTATLPLPSSSQSDIDLTGSTLVLSALKNDDTSRHAKVYPPAIRSEIDTATENSNGTVDTPTNTYEIDVNLCTCEHRQDVVTFADAKTLFTAYWLPHGVIYELYACINEDTGFERENWGNVLMENLIYETMQSSILRVIHNVHTRV